MRNKPSPFLQTWSLIIFFIVLASAFLILEAWGDAPPYVRDFVLVLCAMIGVHLLERQWLWKGIADFNRESLKEVVKASWEIVESSSKIGLEKMSRPWALNIEHLRVFNLLLSYCRVIPRRKNALIKSFDCSFGCLLPASQ